MGLLDTRLVYAPFEYPEFYDYWLKQQQSHWLHTEFSLTGDIQDWSFNLTDAEKHLIGTTVKGFVQCYDSETEVLTDSGWKLFSELKNDKVAQWVSGRVEFVMPTAIYSNNYCGKMHAFSDKWSRVDLLVTPNHRMLYQNRSTLQYKVKPSNELKWSGKIRHMISATKEGTLDSISDIHRLFIAYQADGTSLRYDGSRNGFITNSISVFKERKKERLRYLLSRCDFKWEEKPAIRQGKSYSVFYIYADYKLPKDFSWVNLSDISTNWCLEFIDELSNWDSNIDKFGKITYTTTNKAAFDVAHAVATLSGRYVSTGTYLDNRSESYSTCYKLRVQKNRYGFVDGQAMKKAKKEVDYDGMIYCVTVPSGIVVVRRNGKASISGNTETVVQDYWGRMVLKTFRKPEIAMMASAFSAFEGIHMAGYAYLQDTLGLDDYKAFLDEPTTKAKIDRLLASGKSRSREDIARSLAVFSAFTEGVSLFSSFAILFNFSRFDKLKGVGQVIAASVKDECIHSEAGCLLFRKLVSEYPEILTDEVKSDIVEAARLTVSLEDAFIDKAFELGDVQGLTAYDLKQFIRHRCNTKLQDIGFAQNWKTIDKESIERLSWFSTLTTGVSQGDFFAIRDAVYAKGSVDFNNMW